MVYPFVILLLPVTISQEQRFGAAQVRRLRHRTSLPVRTVHQNAQ